jgi:hypothetical protein
LFLQVAGHNGWQLTRYVGRGVAGGFNTQRFRLGAAEGDEPGTASLTTLSPLYQSGAIDGASLDVTLGEYDSKLLGPSDGASLVASTLNGFGGRSRYNIHSTFLPDFTPLPGRGWGIGKSLGTSEGESVGVSTLDAFRTGEATGTVSVSITFSFDFLAPIAAARGAARASMRVQLANFIFAFRKDFRFQFLGWENL